MMSNFLNTHHRHYHWRGMGCLLWVGNWECTGNAGNVFPATASSRSRHASQHVRDAHAVMHAGIADYQFLTKSVAGERSRHSRRMRNPQLNVSGKRHIAMLCLLLCYDQSCYNKTEYMRFYKGIYPNLCKELNHVYSNSCIRACRPRDGRHFDHFPVIVQTNKLYVRFGV